MTSIRERLVASNLEIEDTNEVIALLERKLDLTKQQLSELDENVAIDYQRQLRKYSETCKREIDILSQQSHSVFVEKQTLIQACKAMMDGMQDAEQDYNAELRGAHRQGEDLIDSERRKYKAGYDERLQKYLGQKAQEQKDTTSKALEPEFNRLKAMHEHEMEQVRINTQQEERRVRDLCQQRLDSALEDEKRAAQEEIKLMLKSIQDRSMKDLEELSREWKGKLRHLNIEHDRELEALRQNLKDKANHQRREHDDELHDLQEHSQQRLLELKRAHIQLLDRLSHEHDEKLRDVKRSTLRAEKEINAKLGIGSKSKKNCSYNDEADDDDEAPRPRSFTARSTPKGSPTKSNKSNKNGHTTNPDENESNDDLTADMLAQLNEVRRAAEEARDKQLQAMIRTLEADNLKLERQYRQELERDRKTISETDTKEEDSLKRRVKSLTEETADLVMEREQLLQAVNDEKKREETIKLELTDLKHELLVYQDGVNVHRSRMQEKEEQHKLALRELQLQYNPILRELQQELIDLNQSIQKEEDQYREESRRMEQRQAEELQRLDANVKQDVARIEEQISHFKDEVEGEKAIAAKLSRLLSRYDRYDLTNKNDGGQQANDEHGLSDEDNDDNGEQVEEELHVTKRRPPSASAVASVVSRVASRVSRTAGSSRVNHPTRGDNNNSDGSSAYSGKSNRTASTASFSAVRASSAHRVRASATHK